MEPTIAFTELVHGTWEGMVRSASTSKDERMKVYEAKAINCGEKQYAHVPDYCPVFLDTISFAAQKTLLCVQDAGLLVALGGQYLNPLMAQMMKTPTRLNKAGTKQRVVDCLNIVDVFAELVLKNQENKEEYDFWHNEAINTLSALDKINEPFYRETILAPFNQEGYWLYALYATLESAWCLGKISQDKADYYYVLETAKKLIETTFDYANMVEYKLQ